VVTSLVPLGLYLVVFSFLSIVLIFCYLDDIHFPLGLVMLTTSLVIVCGYYDVT
jgi:hypothetical protein